MEMTKNFFWNNYIHLICQKIAAVSKEYNVKRHDQTKHANAYDKLFGSDCAENVKQLEAVLASQQRFFTRAHESNENTTRASYAVAMLIVKHGEPFTFYG